MPLYYTIPYENELLPSQIDMRKETLPCITNTSQQDCVLTKDIYKNIKEIRSQIKEKYTAQKIDFLEGGALRKKRGIQVLGDILNFCCSVITEREGDILFKNQHELNENYELMKSTLIEEHADLLNVTSEIKKFSENIDEKLRIQQEELQALALSLFYLPQPLSELKLLITEILTIVQNHLSSEYYHSIVDHCKEHRLSPLFIPQNTLKYDLEKLETKLKSQNLQLAVPISKLSLYYTLGLTHCKISEDNIMFEIKIPINKIERSWKLFKYIPIPFRHEKEICSLHADHALIAYDENKKDLITIAGSNLKDCDTSQGLCFLDTFESDSDNSPLCAKKIFKNRPFHELNTACHFKCEPLHSKTLIKKVNHDTYTITNPKKNLMLLQNFRGEKLYTPLEINATEGGALLLTLPCETELIYNDNGDNVTLIPENFPCSKNTPQNSDIHRILPLQWSTFGGIIIDSFNPIQIKFDNISRIYNRDWKNTTPHFSIKINQSEFEQKFHKIHLDHKSVSLYQSDFAQDLIYTTWLVLLTLVLTFMGYILFRQTVILAEIKGALAPKINKKAVFDTISLASFEKN